MCDKTAKVWLPGMLLEVRKALSREQLAKCESSVEIAVRLGDWKMAQELVKIRREGWSYDREDTE